MSFTKKKTIKRFDYRGEIYTGSNFDADPEEVYLFIHSKYGCVVDNFNVDVDSEVGKYLLKATSFHDKLVEALSGVIKHTNNDGYCECCGTCVGSEHDKDFEPGSDWPHDEDCKVKHAMDLLEDLESKS